MSATGTWNIALNTPMGAQNTTLELVEDGATLTGTMSSPMGPDKMELTGGTVDGDALTWSVAMTQPMPLTLEFSGKVDGDSISGDVKLGSFGDATFTGTRA